MKSKYTKIRFNQYYENSSQWLFLSIIKNMRNGLVTDEIGAMVSRKTYDESVIPMTNIRRRTRDFINHENQI